MGANRVALEVTAGAIPFSLVVTNSVVIVIAAHGHFKLIENHPVFFFGITLGFFDLTDHSTIHHVIGSISLGILNKNTRHT